MLYTKVVGRVNPKSSHHKGKIWDVGCSLNLLWWSFHDIMSNHDAGRQWHPKNPMGGGAWWAAVHGVAKGRIRLSNFTFTFHFHTLEKEMATHSSVLAWRILGAAEPGGLPSMGSHRVGHDWSDLAAAVAVPFKLTQCCTSIYIFIKLEEKRSYLEVLTPWPQMWLNLETGS